MERKFIKLNLETMWWSWKRMFIFHQQSPEEKHSLACKGHNLFLEKNETKWYSDTVGYQDG